MVEIIGNTIRLTRGNTFRTVVDLEVMGDDGELTPYIPDEADEVVFTAKRNYGDEEIIIEKVIPHDTMLLHFTPEDTKDLPQPSVYVYDIVIRYADGDVYTPVSEAILEIRPEV